MVHQALSVTLRFTVGGGQGCCPVPICPNSRPALGPCDGGCPTGSACLGHGCCPLALCPGSSNVHGIQPCNTNTPCPSGLLYALESFPGSGYSCTEQQVCCEQPRSCADGARPTGVCVNGQCLGELLAFCDQLLGLCCPAPTCPDQRTALAPCFEHDRSACPMGTVERRTRLNIVNRISLRCRRMLRPSGMF